MGAVVEHLRRAAAQKTVLEEDAWAVVVLAPDHLARLQDAPAVVESTRQNHW